MARSAEVLAPYKSFDLDLDSGTRFVKTIIPDAFKRALPPPVINARLVDTQALFLASGDRIEKSNLLNEFTIARTAAIRYHYVVKRSLFRSATCQSYCYHSQVPVSASARPSSLPAHIVRRSDIDNFDLKKRRVLYAKAVAMKTGF